MKLLNKIKDYLSLNKSLKQANAMLKKEVDKSFIRCGFLELDNARLQQKLEHILSANKGMKDTLDTIIAFNEKLANDNNELKIMINKVSGENVETDFYN